MSILRQLAGFHFPFSPFCRKNCLQFFGIPPTGTRVRPDEISSSYASLSNLLVLLAVLMIPLGAAWPQGAPAGFVPGQTYYGRNNYVSYSAGNLPIIISVPHDGGLRPTELPDRTGNITLGRDSYTLDLATEITSGLNRRTGKYPHVIVCHLDRVKIDQNREIHEATGDNPLTIISFTDYHNFIDTAAALVTRMYGKGILIDLHGHGHLNQRLELGYLLSASQLDLPDSVLNSASVVSKSSVKSLAQSGTRPLTELLRGESSLGSFFEYRGYPAVPSSMQPRPGSTAYTDTRYITEAHGSVNNGTVDAVQMECNPRLLFIDVNRKKFAEVAAEVFDCFVSLHYFNSSVPKAKLVLNEVLFDVPPGDATTTINGDVNGDGVRSERGDQFIEVANAGTQDADIGGVEILTVPPSRTEGGIGDVLQILEQDTKPVFSFPPHTVLRPNELAVVFGGVGPAGFGLQFSFPRKDFAVHRGSPDSGFYYSQHGDRKLNLLAAGDGVILIHRASNTVFDEILWGNAVRRTTKGTKLVASNTVLGDSIAGSIGESVARSPDFIGPWTRHSQAYGTVYSPGTAGRTPGGVIASGGRPKEFRLLQNFPNPFNPRTSIRFELSAMSDVTLTVHDVLGRNNSTLVKNIYPAGSYTVPWDGALLPSGAYFCRLQAQKMVSTGSTMFIETKKMILQK